MRDTRYVISFKELLERLILVPWGVVYVDHTKSDLRRHLTVKMYPRTGQTCQRWALTTRDLDRQDLSFLVSRECVFQGLRYTRTTLPFTLPPSLFRRKSTLAKRGLVAVIWRMTVV